MFLIDKLLNKTEKQKILTFKKLQPEITLKSSHLTSKNFVSWTKRLLIWSFLALNQNMMASYLHISTKQKDICAEWYGGPGRAGVISADWLLESWVQSQTFWRNSHPDSHWILLWSRAVYWQVKLSDYFLTSAEVSSSFWCLCSVMLPFYWSWRGNFTT